MQKATAPVCSHHHGLRRNRFGCFRCYRRYGLLQGRRVSVENQSREANSSGVQHAASSDDVLCEIKEIRHLTILDLENRTRHQLSFTIAAPSHLCYETNLPRSAAVKLDSCSLVSSITVRDPSAKIGHP
ncbi:cytoplasm protein [Pseudozyma hubeiensis SY62]|uniref:Cytoplasm protein n=1 Tax=Pseudozyma hubeiensis (strain SY62) TaxID=1305764 RepID=R9P1R7_PSEHS|nr:cytoplasm protein [Pseudozyma hubeiensis SY62]GAC95196.1 cytoplasm protein [Pseudozyma hubeiensis SY62]